MRDADAKLFEASTARDNATRALASQELSTAVKEAQRAIEHAIKALYPLTGQPIPKDHSAVRSREAPDAFNKAFANIDFHDDLHIKYGIALLSLKGQMWAPVHEFADYGYASIPPDVLLVDENFGKFAVEQARGVIEAMTQLLRLVKLGQIAIKS